MKKYYLQVMLLSLCNGIYNAAWKEIGDPLNITGQNENDSAGLSVAMNSSGTIVVVGEGGWPGSTTSNVGTGRARAYRLQNGSWLEIGGALDMTGQNSGDLAGWYLDINATGNIIAVGENGWSGDSGRVRVYQLQNGSWLEIGGALNMTGQNSGDLAGRSVAINSDGNIVAVGERGWSGASGRVRVYQLQNGSWLEIGDPLAITGQNINDYVGQGLCLNSQGTILAESEYGWPKGNGNGRVRVYQFQNNTWTEVGDSLAMTGQNSGDNAGINIAMGQNGNFIVMGEPLWPNGNGNGRARAYQFQNNTWTEVGDSLAMTGQNAEDNAGWSVAIDAQARLIAVGEVGWPNGDGNGRVRVYGTPQTREPLVSLLTMQPVNLSQVTLPGDKYENMLPVTYLYSLLKK